MNAVIKVGGKQYYVQENQEIFPQRDGYPGDRRPRRWRPAGASARQSAPARASCLPPKHRMVSQAPRRAAAQKGVGAKSFPSVI